MVIPYYNEGPFQVVPHRSDPSLTRMTACPLEWIAMFLLNKIYVLCLCLVCTFNWPVTCLAECLSPRQLGNEAAIRLEMFAGVLGCTDWVLVTSVANRVQSGLTPFVTPECRRERELLNLNLTCHFRKAYRY